MNPQLSKTQAALRWFNDLRVAAKLTVAFGLVLGAAMTGGIVAVVDMGRLAATAGDITGNWLPSVQRLSEIKANSLQARQFQLRAAIAESETERRDYLRQYHELFEANRLKFLDYEKVIAGDVEHRLWETYSGRWTHYLELDARFVALMQQGRLEEARHLLTRLGKELFNQSLTALDADMRFNYDGASQATARGQAVYRSGRVVVIGLLLIAGVLGAGIAITVSRAISGPLHEAITVLRSIAGGRLDNEMDISRGDEIGALQRGLSDMQGKLGAQLQTERRLAAENSRVRQALDSVSTAVMIADAEHRIVHVNPAGQKVMQEAEPDLRTALPGFSSAHILGSTLDALHTEPAHQRNLLDSLRGAHRTSIDVGGRSLAAVFSSIAGAGGERIGTVVEWQDRTRDVGIEREVEELMADVVKGDLTRRLRVEDKQGFFAVIARSVNQIAQTMAQMIAAVKDAASDVQRGAEEISAGNANLSQRTEQQSSSLEQTASSMEQMTSTVKQNADNAAQANQLASAARDQAESGGGVTEQAVRAMAQINEASTKIADIIGVIDEIAFQTNLLALNAAVEAARAGEQGRGFAVVATEVRSLAGRSATAAKQIKALIEDSVRKVRDGSQLVSQSGQTLEQIVTAVKKVSDIVAEIAAASREQSSGIEQVNLAVIQMDEVTQQNAALVEEATAASQSMAQQAASLNRMMAKYRVGNPSGRVVSDSPAERFNQHRVPVAAVA